MTHVIQVADVDQALCEGVHYLLHKGIEQNSRAGKVLVAPGPVVTEYLAPWNRVMFNPVRDANPFFHLMESLWMLAGRNDVAFPSYYAKQMSNFSDDGSTLHGAYGYRWRKSLGFDQLAVIADELKVNPESRRCVLQMWDADDYGPNDLFKATNGGKDVPCNTQAYFDTIDGNLNMTVCCRSNDIVWGAYGANAVHFSVLHEYMALATDIPQGVYRQFSNNYHMYVDRLDVQRLLDAGLSYTPAYGLQINHTPLFGKFDNTTQQDFEQDVALFFKLWFPGVFIEDQVAVGFRTRFFKSTAVCVANAHHFYKAGRSSRALDEADMIEATDWGKACVEWLQRRKA